MQDNTDTQNTHINNMGETKGNNHRNIQSHNKTHTRVRFHHMVTTSIRRKYQQTTDNTKQRTQNKQQSTTHGNAPKGSGSYLRPKTHIQHIHPQHLSTSTQTSTNHKSTHCNRMG